MSSAANPKGTLVTRDSVHQVRSVLGRLWQSDTPRGEGCTDGPDGVEALLINLGPWEENLAWEDIGKQVTLKSVSLGDLGAYR